ncbi:MAG TPA: polyprenyl diphosphate synthase [Pirellulales bacterium]|jgi:undecaprenyl diphosphate synthase
MQSTCPQLEVAAQSVAGPRHVAIIMDGNGRWAQRRGEPRSHGHQAGATAVRRTIEAAPDLGIRTLTMFAFAAANWQRPLEEVDALMRLLHEYLITETPTCLDRGVRLSLVGRRDRLPALLRKIAEEAERVTREGQTLHLRLAIDYSSREAILAAARRLVLSESISHINDLDAAQFARLLSCDPENTESAPDVDLVIRTGGEQRLSDFLLWESAQAELYFTNRMWPEFDASDLAAAVEAFNQRERRFGKVSAATPH